MLFDNARFFASLECCALPDHCFRYCIDTPKEQKGEDPVQARTTIGVDRTMSTGTPTDTCPTSKGGKPVSKKANINIATLALNTMSTAVHNEVLYVSFVLQNCRHQTTRLKPHYKGIQVCV